MPTPDHHPGFPARAALRPGVRVVRRSATELQVGIGDDAVALPDSPAVRLLLRGLADGRPPAPPAALSPAARRACELLLDHQLVADADTWCSALDGLAGEAAATRSALVAEAGLATGERLARRSIVRVGVCASGLPAAGTHLEALLATTGLAPCAPADADVLAVLSEGEPSRSLLDDLVRSERPHVLLVVREGAVRVGPFVQPGLTACQRCIDAHGADADPRLPLVLQQYVGPSRSLWGLPAPVPADLAAIATAVLARDLTRWADALQPATWSTTIEVDPGLTLPRTQWSRHAACGCSSNIRSA